MDRTFSKKDKADGRLEQQERSADTLHQNDFWGIEQAKKQHNERRIHELFSHAANELSDATHR